MLYLSINKLTTGIYGLVFNGFTSSLRGRVLHDVTSSTDIHKYTHISAGDKLVIHIFNFSEERASVENVLILLQLIVHCMILF